MKKIKFVDLFICIIIPELVGVLSSLFSGNQKEFYSSLTLPAFSPPSWVFPVVWPIMYLLMGIASYLINNSAADKSTRKKALTLYGIQLFFNFLWSVVFFGMEAIGLAAAVIIILIIFVILTILAFYKINKKAAYLMIPYLIWLLFAAYLNIGVFILNR